MLSDIIEAQKIDASVNPGFIKSAIYHDCLWGLAWEYPGIPFLETPTPPKVEWVMSILQMWTTIEASYSKLTEKNKKIIEHQANPFGSDPRFGGFDPNSEADEIRITNFLINDLRRFLNFKDRDIHSPIPLSGRYKRMYAIYDNLFAEIQQGALNTDQIIEILQQG